MVPTTHITANGWVFAEVIDNILDLAQHGFTISKNLTKWAASAKDSAAYEYACALPHEKMDWEQPTSSALRIAEEIMHIIQRARDSYELHFCTPEGQQMRQMLQNTPMTDAQKAAVASQSCEFDNWIVSEDELDTPARQKRPLWERVLDILTLSF